MYPETIVFTKVDAHTPQLRILNISILNVCIEVLGTKVRVMSMLVRLQHEVTSPTLSQIKL